MNFFKYHPPLDLDCPDVQEFHEGHEDDPISKMCGRMGEITMECYYVK
jgi:hypothetical protein